MAGYVKLGCVGSYVDLRHPVSGCGCERAGSPKRYGEMLECWMDGVEVEER
jgi:hypothetical protein